MNINKFIFCLILSVNSGLFCLGQLYEEDYKIQYPTIQNTGNQTFGENSASNENWLVIGSHLESHSGYQSGEVYVYSKNPDSGKWELFQNLLPDDTAYSEYHFGNSVSIYDDRIAVGAYNARNGGEFYIFHYNSSKKSWVKTKKLTHQEKE